MSAISMEHPDMPGKAKPNILRAGQMSEAAGGAGH